MSGPLVIVAYGVPAPQGSKKIRGQHNGRPVLVDDCKRTKSWRETVHYAALQARATQPPLEGPIRARIVFTLPKPKSAPKRVRTWPARKPDLSKLLRAVEDSLTSAGVWRDDAQLVGCDRLEKVFPNEDQDALDAPGVYIEVWEVKP